MTLASVTLTESVKARALDLGFDRVAVGPVSAPSAASRGVITSW